MGDTHIAWTQKTWNPTTGCSRVSPGCEKCYAEALSLRFGWSEKPWTARNAAENVRLHPDRLDQPLRWKKPSRIFVNSMSDLFHEQIPDEFIVSVFNIMAEADRHTYQVLTKRPERMRAWTERYRGLWFGAVGAKQRRGLPLPNVWLGTSVEDQRRADERIPILLQTPAAIRFISAEPLLGPIDVRPWLPPLEIRCCQRCQRLVSLNTAACPQCGGAFATRRDPRIDWVICGGESGPQRRPFNPDWARAIRDQCQAAGTAFFYKQGAALRPGQDNLLDDRAWEEYPE